MQSIKYGFMLGLLTFGLLWTAAGCSSEESPGGVEEIVYEQIKAWIEDQEVMKLIDIRKPADFAAGHLQDAVNIDFETFMDENKNLIDNGSALTSKVSDKSAKIVFYCTGYGLDKVFAEAAFALGYKHVYHYTGGADEWISKGNYFIIEYAAFKAWHDAKKPFTDGENYLIDVLPVDWYTGDDPQHPGGHIPSAVNIPMEDWTTAEGVPIDDGKAFTDVVKNQNAIVVIYCGNWSCGKSLTGAKAALALGFKKILRYQGGWQEWQDEGNALTPGPNP